MLIVASWTTRSTFSSALSRKALIWAEKSATCRNTSAMNCMHDWTRSRRISRRGRQDAVGHALKNDRVIRVGLRHLHWSARKRSLHAKVQHLVALLHFRAADRRDGRGRERKVHQRARALVGRGRRRVLARRWIVGRRPGLQQRDGAAVVGQHRPPRAR